MASDQSPAGNKCRVALVVDVSRVWPHELFVASALGVGTSQTPRLGVTACGYVGYIRTTMQSYDIDHNEISVRVAKVVRHP